MFVKAPGFVVSETVGPVVSTVQEAVSGVPGPLPLTPRTRKMCAPSASPV